MTHHVEHLPGVDLATMDRHWRFQTRIDRKYLVDLELVTALTREIDTGTRVLRIDGRSSFRYRSLYFDTPELSSYHDAAHRRPRRSKVRVRSYLDSGLDRLQVKARDGRGRTVKLQQPKLDDPSRLSHRDRTFVATCVGHEPGHLEVALGNAYRRTTLVLPDGSGRATIDTDLEFWLPEGASGTMGDVAVLETKAGSHPTAVDRWLWSRRVRPIRFSKYCTTLAILRPELPANAWHRIVSRQRRVTGQTADCEAVAGWR